MLVLHTMTTTNIYDRVNRICSNMGHAFSLSNPSASDKEREYLLIAFNERSHSLDRVIKICLNTGAAFYLNNPTSEEVKYLAAKQHASDTQSHPLRRVLHLTEPCLCDHTREELLYLWAVRRTLNSMKNDVN